MEFNNNQPIYLQIAEQICDQILLDKLLCLSRLPSVRELAISFEVNPNTVVRSYAYLEQETIIYKQRGIGYFVANGAKEKILEQRKEVFLNQTLPEMIKQMKVLKISSKEVIELLSKEQ